ncbi:MAG: dienelactone hydrolase family protein [Proteobacteria bacterium]|nr:dienelactone hydrolase family protein [Pseudomonadota bacterium]
MSGFFLTGPSMAPASGGDPKSIVVILHGYGSNGLDLIALAPQWRQALPDTLFLAPNAPEPCPGAPDGYQWWPIRSFSMAERMMGVAEAAPVLNGYLDNLLNRWKLDETRLALVGFSQGTMLALHVATQRAKPVAGVVGYSGMIADEEALAKLKSKPPVLLVHGDADQVVPFQAFERAKSLLEGQDFDLTTHVLRGLPHSIDPTGARLGGEFLARVLA